MQFSSSLAQKTHIFPSAPVLRQKPFREPQSPSINHFRRIRDRNCRFCTLLPAICTDSDAALDKAQVVQTPEGLNVTVREARSNVEFEQIGWIRARAYYATRPVHRFKATFIKQFAQKEARSLIMRTKKKGKSPAPEIVCLAAVLPYSDPRTKDRGNVVGTIDIRPPRSAGGEHPEGVPQEEANGAHLLNLVVESSWRNQGCGTLLMNAAEALVQKRYNARKLYVEVSVHNTEAQSLYSRLGYSEVDRGGENLLFCKECQPS